MEMRVCDVCGRWVENNETLFAMTVTLQAEAGVVNIDDATSGNDARDDFENLVRAMERMSAQQIDDATDEVHESYRFTLCSGCRKEVHNRMKSRTKILET